MMEKTIKTIITLIEIRGKSSDILYFYFYENYSTV